MVKFKRISSGIYESEDGKWLINNIDTPEYGIYKFDGHSSELVAISSTIRDAKNFVNSVK